MKTPWFIPLILCAACGSHQPAVQQKKDSIPDTTKTVKHVVSNSPVTAPVVNKEDTIKGAPGPTRVFITDLNYDSIPDTISLRMLGRDTTWYNSVTMSIARYGKHSWKATSGWCNIDDDFPKTNENAYPTKHFFLAKNSVETLLVLFGWDYEDGRGEFSIIRIKDNVPKLVFDQHHWKDNVDFPMFFKDMDNDGRFEFGYVQMIDAGEHLENRKGWIRMYNPTMIYTVDDSCILNKPVMKKYNQENYVFAGYARDGSIKVFIPDDTTRKCQLWKE